MAQWCCRVCRAAANTAKCSQTALLPSLLQLQKLKSLTSLQASCGCRSSAHQHPVAPFLRANT
jgi:hypothetical protein